MVIISWDVSSGTNRSYQSGKQDDKTAQILCWYCTALKQREMYLSGLVTGCDAVSQDLESQLCSSEVRFSARLSLNVIGQRQNGSQRQEFTIVHFLAFNRRSYLEKLTTSSWQRHTDRLQTRERGDGGEKTISGKQCVLYFYFLFDACGGISWAV